MMVQFRGDASFTRAQFDSYAAFTQAEFGGGARFSEARFGGGAWFGDAEFRGDAGLNESPDFTGATASYPNNKYIWPPGWQTEPPTSGIGVVPVISKQ
jgi:hypothetical protein